MRCKALGRLIQSVVVLPGEPQLHSDLRHSVVAPGQEAEPSVRALKIVPVFAVALQNLRSFRCGKRTAVDGEPARPALEHHREIVLGSVFAGLRGDLLEACAETIHGVAAA